MKVSVWPEWVGVLVAIALGTVMVRGWPGPLVLVESHAAWVQAVGSILAIFVAIYVASRQANQVAEARATDVQFTRDKRQIETLDKINGTAAILDGYGRACMTICNDMIAAINADKPYPFSSSTVFMQIGEDAVVKIPLHEPPYTAFANSCLNMRMSAAELMRGVRDHTAGFHASPGNNAKLVVFFEQCRTKISMNLLQLAEETAVERALVGLQPVH